MCVWVCVCVLVCVEVMQVLPKREMHFNSSWGEKKKKKEKISNAVNSRSSLRLLQLSLLIPLFFLSFFLFSAAMISRGRETGTRGGGMRHERISDCFPSRLSRCHVWLAGAPRGSGIALDLARSSPPRSFSGAPLGGFHRIHRIYLVLLDGTELSASLRRVHGEKHTHCTDKK